MSDAQTPLDMQTAEWPMWVVICEDCGDIGTVYEKPGTGCHYVRHCWYCGGTSVRDERVASYEDRQRVADRVAASRGIN